MPPHGNKLILPAALRGGFERNSTGIAIEAPGREPLAYHQLLEQTRAVSRTLQALGVRPGVRVATLLRSGPETAVLSLAVMSCAALTPLNPDLTATELERDLALLGAEVLVVPWNLDSPALEVAHRLGLTILRMQPRLDAPAGTFELQNETPARRTEHLTRVQPTESDVALVLHTSGTTSTPKVVPLTHKNLSLSAANIARSMRLGPGDVCLNVMPLFHVHGLIGALLSSIAAGATVICPPGFVATEFFDWMDECGPTWYTAVPTMHQAILARAPRNSEIIGRHPLRFIRSCSAALPEPVAQELESTFSTQVIEAYGMTEASHQLAITPLGAEGRRSGSVGRASGPEVAIMDQDGRLLGQNETGEIVARGPSIMAGYENNPAANDAAFSDGWLRTGDQGYIDADGYVFITGRIKELINRAGEKIAPREIEDALLTHAAVEQAVAFAVPDAKLGEEPAAVIVLRPGKAVDATLLRAHVASRLAAFKVPRIVKVVDEIPKGPTGKPQRAQMARRLGLTAQPETAPVSIDTGVPLTPLERRVAKLWASVLRICADGIQPGHQFTDLGGDSILAAQVVARVPDVFGIEVSLLDMFEHGTVETFARQIAHLLPSARQLHQHRIHLVPIQTAGDRLPLFAVHGVFGDVACFTDLARELGPDQPVYGLQAQGIDGVLAPLTRIEDMAYAYIAEMRQQQPHGPYQLIGYSGGGSIAFEMARQLELAGDDVALVAVVDHAPYAFGYHRPEWNARYVPRAVANALRRAPYALQAARWLGWRKSVNIVQARLKITARALRGRVSKEWETVVDRVANAHADDLEQMPDYRLEVVASLDQANRDYVPLAYGGSIVLIRCERQPLLCAHTPDMGWSRLVRGRVVVNVVPGSHRNVLYPPYIGGVACALKAHLMAAPAPAPREHTPACAA